MENGRVFREIPLAADLLFQLLSWKVSVLYYVDVYHAIYLVLKCVNVEAVGNKKKTHCLSQKKRRITTFV